MPSSSGPGPEPGVAVGSSAQEKHPLYRLSSNDSTRSADVATSNNHASYGAPLPRVERLVSSSSSSSTSTSGNPKACRETNGMGAQDAKVAAIAAATGRPDLTDHFPDGGWGWVVVAAATCVHVLCSGIHLAFGTLFLHIREHFLTDDIETTWLGSLGVGISLFIAPFITIICRRKSPRLYGVIGGLICALGCLFLAFSNKPEQLFISHCVVMSLGSGVTIATANIMVGRYFKRRREMAETILVAGSGLGTALTSFLFHQLISTIKWMHGLQCMAGLLILTIISGALYRSASLYHPRRDVILHLKSQKKNRRDREAEKPPYLDFSALRMRSLQALMVIAAVVGIGIHVPFILLVRTAQQAGVDAYHLLLHSVYVGLGFVLGCAALGYVTIRTSADCFICRRHLVQTAAIAGGVLTLLLVMARDASAFSLYAWAYGMAAGAYYLGLKLYALELVSQQLMERAWSFLSAVQCFPFLFGAPVASYLKAAYQTDNAGYVFAGTTMVAGGLLFYSMPYFERHASNHVVLQKQTSACSSSMTAEAAALLEVDLSDGGGGGGCKVSNHLHCVLAPRACRSVGMGKDGGRGCQAPVPQHGKERERNGGGKATVLSRIMEERDAARCSPDAACRAASCNRGSNSVEQASAKQESGEPVADGPSDSAFSNKTDKSSGRESSKTSESKKSKKTDVRVDFFDPPSQEKESTATVSYDSDLYINLCEAQV